MKDQDIVDLPAGDIAGMLGKLMNERHHNRQLRLALAGAAAYGALATIAALLGWLR